MCKQTKTNDFCILAFNLRNSLSAPFNLPFTVLNASLMDTYLGICSSAYHGLHLGNSIALMDKEDIHTLLIDTAC